ncbi:MAG: hypothetical protein K2H67_05285 [Treponemataceae bacterium]|nr:hypothetical protein [Treponemataceae bacterium]
MNFNKTILCHDGTIAIFRRSVFLAFVLNFRKYFITEFQIIQYVLKISDWACPALRVGLFRVAFTLHSSRRPRRLERASRALHIPHADKMKFK